MPSIKSKALFSNITRKYGIYIILLLIIIVGTLLNPVFLTYKNFASVARQISVTGILAFGETLVIISGCTDISLGSLVAFSGMCLVFWRRSGNLLSCGPTEIIHINV